MLPAHVIPNVLELNEQTTEYESICHTSFRFPHRLLLGQSIGEFLKLRNDRFITLRPRRDVSLLIVVQELGNANLGGLC